MIFNVESKENIYTIYSKPKTNILSYIYLFEYINFLNYLVINKIKSLYLFIYIKFYKHIVNKNTLEFCAT